MNDKNESTPVDGQFKVVPPESGVNKTVKALLVAIIGVIATIYLVNPTAGIIECLPDNIPVIGNLDEAGATAILISCLAYFGIDVTQIIKRRKSNT
jgi:uncharacterized membrane protein YkvA (DUF1232 family)